MTHDERRKWLLSLNKEVLADYILASFWLDETRFVHFAWQHDVSRLQAKRKAASQAAMAALDDFGDTHSSKAWAAYERATAISNKYWEQLEELFGNSPSSRMAKK